MCAAFGGWPDEAERQPWAVIRAILDYRNAQSAIEQVNRGRDGVDVLMRNAHLADVLLRMHRAQSGAGVTMADVWEAVAARIDAAGDES